MRVNFLFFQCVSERKSFVFPNFVELSLDVIFLDCQSIDLSELISRVFSVKSMNV